MCKSAAAFAIQQQSREEDNTINVILDTPPLLLSELEHNIQCVISILFSTQEKGKDIYNSYLYLFLCPGN